MPEGACGQAVFMDCEYAPCTLTGQEMMKILALSSCSASADDLPFRALLPTILGLGSRFANLGGVNNGCTDSFAVLGQTAEAARLCETEALPFIQR